MAYTVDAAFDTFYEQINLSGDHRQTANARKDDVVASLKNTFDVLDAFATGSIPKFTALKGSADLDVMVVLHYSKHIKDKTPSQVLESVQKALSEYRTNVRKNGQAVTLYYKTWPNVDIVPVSRKMTDDDKVDYYSVPNANDGTWIKARPRKFANAIEAKSTECGQNFRRIIKMIKHWNLTHSEFLTGYHIEVLALNVLSGDLDDTPWNVFQFFNNARPLLQSLLWYELGYADLYLSAEDRIEVIKRFDTAIAKSRDAWYATYDGRNDDRNAIELWKQIFGDKFPSYG
jgi:hypothetical protein